MASQGKSTILLKTNSHSLLSPLERLEVLINNEYLSDVAFRVGATGKRMFGHKLVLEMASEVFGTQFKDCFVDARQTAIELSDIEPPAFEEILRFMYVEKVHLTTENITGVYYASQKYLLTKLIALCKEFLSENIDENNVLNLFDGNRRYEFDFVNNECLDIITDNPLKVFAHADFLTLQLQSVALIAQRRVMNCSKMQFLKAMEDYKNSRTHEDEIEEAKKIVTMVQETQDYATLCRKLHSFSGFYHKVNVDTNMSIEATSTLSLYGIGIFVKAQGKVKKSATVKLNIFITKEDIDDLEVMQSVQLSKTVPVSDQLRTEEIMFEKVTIDDSFLCNIRVQILDQQNQKLPMFCQWRFEPVDDGIWDFQQKENITRHELDQSLKTVSRHSNSYMPYQVAQNCLSYVMYTT